jgi:hypothetical protein
MRATQQCAVRVAESGSGPYSQIVWARRHVSFADEAQTRSAHDGGPLVCSSAYSGIEPARAARDRDTVVKGEQRDRKSADEIKTHTSP